MNKLGLLSILLLLALASGGVGAQNPLDEVFKALEIQQMKRLSIQQQRAGITIDAFRSDGCSGGMSATWGYLSDTLSEFVRFAGDKPPWEHCCVEHDRHYWQGMTIDGFEKRVRADVQLRVCVQLSGQKKSDEISNVLGLPQQDIVDLINLTGDLMYQAVRIGGAPCTGLSWRWGHGWPPCSVDSERDSRPSPEKSGGSVAI